MSMNETRVLEKMAGRMSYQSFFTDATEINTLMISLLGNVKGAKVLEPCAGRGALIKPILKVASQIDAIDIDPEHVRTLVSISAESLGIQEGDFIDYFVGGPLISRLSIARDYDAIVCNPPYGLRFSISYRKAIKKRFPELYARESYGLFMVFGLKCLKEGGRFVYIVPNTFLTSRNHRSLREFLRDNANVTHFIQFDSARFGTVNFGYSHLCIIAGNRSSTGQIGDVRWLDYTAHRGELTLRAFETAQRMSPFTLRKSTHDGWIFSVRANDLFSTVCRLLGQIAECRTGIYTGNNRKFCGYDVLHRPSRINGHAIDWSEVRTAATLSKEERTNGLADYPYYVPFVRGGHRAPFEKTRSALLWSQEDVTFYRSNKKARLQNSAFYFHRGLAVPMVTSGHLSASYMEGAVFDQGVVGVFPKKENWLEYLLVFLNSGHATDMKRSISPGANNSANYLKRLSIPIPNDLQLKEASAICKSWRDNSVVRRNAIRKDATDFVTNHFLPA